ncbi:MAG: DUF692 family protein [Nannocystaceae bacterium]
MTDAPLHGVGLGLRWDFLDEVAAGEAPPALRFFEVSPENYMRRGGFFPSALAEVAARYPLITHGLMMGIGGSSPIEAAYLDPLRDLLRALGVDRHSDHLCWSAHDGRCLHDLLPLPIARAHVRAVADRIRRAQDRLGVPLAVENVSYYGAPGWSPAESAAMGMAERDLLCEILEAAECGLLLDVNNVVVNARNHGFDPLAYLEGIDLRRVVQLHVAGGERLAAHAPLWIDTHGASVPPEVRSLMAWVIRRTGPRPVIYERDHRIPPLAELAAEVEVLQSIYDEALGSRAPLGDPRARRAALPDRLGRDLGDLRGVESAFTGLILGPDAPAIALARADASPVLRDMSAARVDVYRRLVRGNLRGLLARLLPRTLARLGDAATIWIDAWLAEVGPRSRILRELALEWVAWVTPRWAADPSIPGDLVDLVRHEAIEIEVGGAPDEGGGPTPEVADAFTIASRLRFDPSLRLQTYAHRVHELPESIDDRSAAAAGRCVLLIYRDAEHEVRFLELSPLAEATVRRLLEGASVAVAIAGAAASIGEAVDDPLLARIAALLADLSARGIVRGVA